MFQTSGLHPHQKAERHDARGRQRVTVAFSRASDFETLLSCLFYHLFTSRQELRDLNARPVPTTTFSTLRHHITTKVASLHRRTDTIVIRHKTRVGARDERQRLANVTLTTTVVADEAPEQRSKRDFLINTEKDTLFQGRQGYLARDTIGRQSPS